jgi:hypothetical protein
MLMGILLALTPQSAQGAEAVISAAGGLDYLTQSPWTGLDLAFHASNPRGWEPIGRVTPSWGLKDDTVVVFAELGAVHTIPNDQATIRAGLVSRWVSYMGAYVLPIQPGGLPRAGEPPQWGVVPGGYALLEFDMGEVSPFTIGFHAGVGSAVADYGCTADSDPTGCLYWDPAFIGGFVTRYRHKSGFVLDTRFGPSARLGLGWSFGAKAKD